KTQDVLVAVDGEDVVGYVKFRRPYEIPSADHVRQIHGFAVDPARRGEGIGRMLLDEAADAARRDRGRRLPLHVCAPNEAARRVYEKAGYVVEGVLRGEFFLNGQYVDDVAMALDLTPAVS